MFNTQRIEYRRARGRRAETMRQTFRPGLGTAENAMTSRSVIHGSFSMAISFPDDERARGH